MGEAAAAHEIHRFQSQRGRVRAARTAAQADGRTLGEWCREVILRGGAASDDPALAAEPVTYHAGIHPAELTLVDLNGDGNLDVAVTSNLGLYVFLGKGDGTVSAPKVYHPGDFPSWVLSADFNGDGIPDLAVANNTNPKRCHVTILLGKGDGTFQLPIPFRVGDGPTGLITADFNHDGKPDLATLTGPSGITVLLNTTPFAAPPHSH